MSQSTTNVSATSGGVAVAGNVAGSINVNNRSVEVHTNYGTVINQAERPPVQLRGVAPQPPRAPLDFFDRASELAQIDQLITANKPVVIYGLDGTGKSTLMRQAANGNAAHALPNGVVLIEGIDEEGTALKLGDVIQRLFDALYESELPLKVNDAIARTYLSNTRPLVLLDNIQLASADHYRTLIDLFPQSAMLIALPKSLPGLARPMKLGPLPRAEAIELLAAQIGVPVDDANRSTFDAICQSLDDVPLAIVRVGDVIREDNLPLDRARETLSSAQTSAGDAITTGLERAYALALSVLSDEERAVLATVAHSPGTSVDANTLTANTAIVDRLTALGLLHANSPIRIDAGLRSFARTLAGEDAIKDRLIARLLDDARSHKTLDDAYCASELGNILSLIEWAANRNRWSDVIVLGRAIDRYLTLHGLWDAWQQVLNRVLQAARSSNDRSAEAWALHQLGTHATDGDVDQAKALYRQALEIRQAIGDTIAAAYSQHNLDILILPPLPPRDQPKPPSQPQPPSPAPVVLSAAVKAALIVIAGLVVIAAGVLLSGGIFVGPQACLNDPRASARPIDRALADQIEEAKRLTAGQTASLEFSEAMLDDYVRDFSAANNLLDNGQARFAGDDLIVICGVYQGNTIAARFRFQLNNDAPVALENIAARMLDTRGAFGWTVLPNGLAGPVVDQFKGVMGNNFTIAQLDTRADAGVWRIDVRGKGTPVAAAPTPAIEPTLEPTHIPPPESTHTPVPTPTHTPQPTDTPEPTPVSWLIPYFALRNDRYEIFATNDDGSQQTQVTDGISSGNYDPVISPNGRHIAFWAFGDGDQRDLYVLNVDDRQPRKLLSTIPYDFHIVWSPGSQSIAVTLQSSIAGAGPRTDIFLVPIQRGEPIQLTSLDRDREFVHTDPTFSPDGSQLAYVPRTAGDFGGTGITIVNRDGSGVQKIAEAGQNFSLDVRLIAWSPNGRQIALIGRDTSNSDFARALPDLYVINVDGSGLRPLTRQLVGSFSQIAWSPDGRHLAFIADNVMWITSVDQPEPQLLRDQIHADPNRCSFDAAFVWSPDSQRLAFNTDRDGTLDIHTIDINNRDERNLKLDPPGTFVLSGGC